jgi:hypothetical protein
MREHLSSDRMDCYWHTNPRAIVVYQNGSLLLPRQITAFDAVSWSHAEVDESKISD